eukprot:15158660-Ditylum_brightwellii.AAC.1
MFNVVMPRKARRNAQIVVKRPLMILWWQILRLVDHLGIASITIHMQIQEFVKGCIKVGSK